MSNQVEVADTVVKEAKVPRFSFSQEETNERTEKLIHTMQLYMRAMLGTDGVVPDISLSDSGTQFLFHVDLQDDSHGGILIGPNKCNVLGMLNLLRMQQIRPHNRQVVLVYKFPSGKVETFKDDHLFGKRTNLDADDFYLTNGIPAPHIKGRKPKAAKAKSNESQKLVKEGFVNDNARPKSKQDASEGQIRKVLIEKLKYEMKVDTAVYNLETMTVEQLQEAVALHRQSRSAKLRTKT